MSRPKPPIIRLANSGLIDATVDWLIATPKHLRPEPTVPILRLRGLSAKEACEALRRDDLLMPRAGECERLGISR